jgi:hypothetical protein
MKIKLIKSKENKQYTEIFQTISLLFSFVTQKEDTFTQLFTPVKCRDFLGDVIWSRKTKNPSQIYGFNYNYTKNPTDNDALKLSITFPNPETMHNFVINFKYLTNKEISEAKVKESELLATDDPLTLIVIADKIWQSDVWKISLFTYYLKIISYKDMTKLENPENRYAELLTKDMEKKFLSKIKSNLEKPADNIMIAHNYSGFISIIKNQNKEMNKLLLEN